MAIYELLGAELGQLPIHLFFTCKSEKLARQAQVIKLWRPCFSQVGLITWWTLRLSVQQINNIIIPTSGLQSIVIVSKTDGLF